MVTTVITDLLEIIVAHLASPPGECNVGGPQGIVSNPPALLELEGRGRVDIRDEGTTQSQA